MLLSMLDYDDPFRQKIREEIAQQKRWAMQTSRELLDDVKRRERSINAIFARTGAASDLTREAANEEKLLNRDAAILQLLIQAKQEDDQTREADKLIQTLSNRLLPFTNNNSVIRENQKLLYEQDGEWARHFSTVRMTVITFTVTACTAIVALVLQNSQSASLSPPSATPNPGPFPTNQPESLQLVAVLTVLLWVLGATVFWAFTYATYQKIDQIQKRRLLLPTTAVPFEKRKPLPFDSASLVVAVAAVAFAWLGIKEKDYVPGFFQVVLWVAAVIGLAFPFALPRLILRCRTKS